MQSWPFPHIPEIPGNPIALSLFDTADGVVKPVEVLDGHAGMYVCGITPYDSTHLGHAATYLSFDLINRVLRDNQVEVTYIQNVTDVDDPLFERAARDGVDWQALGTSQIDLFRSDMEALQVIPPSEYVGAIEAIPEVIELVEKLFDAEKAYVLEDPNYPDVYAPITATTQFGYESNYSRGLMETLFAERGGDPTRAGKRDCLDALVWRQARPGEPSWPSPFGQGRPGWHIECAAIASKRLGSHFAIQGGGADLRFPHHEFSAAHIEAAYSSPRMAHHYVHAGMIAYEGTKMSKSLGNLVFVSKLRAAGHEANAIRLGLFAGHYRAQREWTAEVLTQAEQRLALWRQAISVASSFEAAEELVQQIRTLLANDLQTPAVLQAVDKWAAQVPVSSGNVSHQAGQLVQRALHALLGVEL
ncbi:cysteine--1-D-myo-inosityl 2-amino-2-deoxy-alpha-D-glucopyranoside ligase [Corynebacterium sp. HS2168-gen11]|uniref:cysteine--1-D-myo-inosityl 2-amino-2-deoxy-alpha-D-glucopyranoside ligase n=1 Tax=Corynebacterium sp. HS2168-gen11 TaxID=2974027 RepID=UPI00216AD4F4|nr:cysteine--1-D-myo-inosityl 2-amino-2-deoxy-alpha-D-glucopyranoside ligase [Corynebacterium sp. HS2168-gen11]MCS4535092.1 cysteine--1-D-myo-inosityl 2-amino-2-deoxy-alpha-D-glucopyranoside ligase [Corynebacterium sp. HS2168-gen11]